MFRERLKINIGMMMGYKKKAVMTLLYALVAQMTNLPVKVIIFW